MFPNYLDGAKVKYYTKKDDFGTVDCNDGERILDIKYLAICSYANEFLGGSYETKRTLRKSMARNSTQFP